MLSNQDSLKIKQISLQEKLHVICLLKLQIAFIETACNLLKLHVICLLKTDF